MAQNTLAKKLFLKPGLKAMMIHAPEGYVETLGVEVATGITGMPDTSADFVQLFVRNSRELEERITSALKALMYDGLLWIAYPKGTSKVATDLNRDILWKAMEQYGVTGVAMVFIDDTWSAMRFRPIEKVGKK